VFYFAVFCGEPGAGFGGVVVEGAHAASVGDVAGLINDVEAFRPGGVRVVGGVVHVIDAEGNGKLEALGEIVGDGQALRERFRLRVADVVFQVGFHLPFVGGMRLANVDGQKIGVVFVVVVDRNDVANLAAKGWSSKTAEDENQRAGAGAFADVKMIFAVERHEARVGGVVADFQRAAVHVGQGVVQHADGIFRTAGHVGEHAESGHEENREDARRPFQKTFQISLRDEQGAASFRARAGIKERPYKFLAHVARSQTLGVRCALRCSLAAAKKQ